MIGAGLWRCMRASVSGEAEPVAGTRLGCRGAPGGRRMRGGLGPGCLGMVEWSRGVRVDHGRAGTAAR